jgi:hypothetical protein
MSQQRVIRRLMVKAHHSGRFLNAAWHRIVYNRLMSDLRRGKYTLIGKSRQTFWQRLLSGSAPHARR